jgi:hypothetical protein
MTMINEIFNSAQSIDVNRTKLVAHSVSRNGRLLTASRNWVNPWRFVVVPKPIWDWNQYRSQIEPVIAADRYTAQTVSFGNNAFNNAGANWIAQYQGSLPSAYFTAGFSFSQAAGTTATARAAGATYDYIATQPSDFVLFKPGDLVQAAGNLYPHVVTEFVTKAQATSPLPNVYEFPVPIHRGWLGTAPANAQILVGAQCTFNLVCTLMPTYRFVPPKRMEFTSNFEFMEQVL